MSAVRRLAVMCLVCVLAGLVLSSSSVVPAAAGSALPTTRFHRRPPHKKGKSNLSRRQEVKFSIGLYGRTRLAWRVAVWRSVGGGWFARGK